MGPSPRRHRLDILSANIRGFLTNVGELTHSFVIKHNIDFIVTVETFLDETVVPAFAKIPGYSQWIRRDRQGMRGGGIAVCYKENMLVQTLPLHIPSWMEMFFRVTLANDEAILLVAMYRPQWQGAEPIRYLINRLDTILEAHNCQNVIIVGDLNQHLIQATFDELTVVHGLVNHVDFPTHIRGGSLDPVLTDLSEGTVQCQPLDSIGTSDHLAVLSHVRIAAALDECSQREIWLWDHADWTSVRDKLRNTVWDSFLTGNVNHDTEKLTSYILNLQQEHVPSHVYRTRPEDQPWFGYRCRLAADSKYKAWVRLKQHPTRRNKLLHKAACQNMKNTVKWAVSKWESDIKCKLRGNEVGSKQWWSLIKEKQGTLTQERIPVLERTDRSLATRSQEKAELLAGLFSAKMTTQEPNRLPPALPHLCSDRLQHINITEGRVYKLLKSVNTKKATGPDNISPHILKRCAKELALPLKLLFSSCLHSKEWPTIWKHARVTPVHKKNVKSNPKNYRPISLLSVISKIFEKIIAEQLTDFLDGHKLICMRQYGFRQGRSTSDLLLLLSKKWNDALDAGLVTLVIALDIAGAFDCVWHQGLIVKLEALGISGSLLELFSNYLTGRSLTVVVNGQASSSYNTGASVPQGSVLGPILWNIFINDLLQGLPSSYAYADDCTLSHTYRRDDIKDVVDIINQQLNYIESWGQRWQVKFAAEKTQAMVISRSPRDLNELNGKLKFNNNNLEITSSLNILGVTFDSRLSLECHVKEIAHKASLKISALRRMKSFLDAKGLLTLYKAQVRSSLEYASLAWMSCSRTHLLLLDKVQRRAERLIADVSQQQEMQEEPPTNLDTLEHRRKVASLTVLHKAQLQKVRHLEGLRLPWRQSQRSTRTVLSSDCLVEVPRSHTSLHQRTFSTVAANLWNSMTTTIPVRGFNTQQMKMAANQWCRQQQHLQLMTNR